MRNSAGPGLNRPSCMTTRAFARQDPLRTPIGSKKPIKILERTISRRSVMAGGVVAVMAYVARPVFRPAKAQAQPTIIAAPVGEVPTGPDDSLWGQAQAATVTLNPQNLVLPRVFEAAPLRWMSERSTTRTGWVCSSSG